MKTVTTPLLYISQNDFKAKNYRKRERFTVTNLEAWKTINYEMFID